MGVACVVLARHTGCGICMEASTEGAMLLVAALGAVFF